MRLRSTGYRCSDWRSGYSCAQSPIWLEATVQTLGFRRVIGLAWGRSVAISLGINSLYILQAIAFVR
jgi:hypothetical protein